MFGNGQYVISAKAGIQIPVWTLCRWQIMPSAKTYYDWYKSAKRIGGQASISDGSGENKWFLGFFILPILILPVSTGRWKYPS